MGGAWGGPGLDEQRVGRVASYVASSHVVLEAYASIWGLPPAHKLLDDEERHGTPARKWVREPGTPNPLRRIVTTMAYGMHSHIHMHRRVRGRDHLRMSMRRACPDAHARTCRRVSVGMHVRMHVPCPVTCLVVELLLSVGTDASCDDYEREQQREQVERRRGEQRLPHRKAPGEVRWWRWPTQSPIWQVGVTKVGCIDSFGSLSRISRRIIELDNDDPLRKIYDRVTVATAIPLVRRAERFHACMATGTIGARTACGNHIIEGKGEEGEDLH